MSEGYEYNLLTQELLLQGYTAEHYPDYVRIGNGRLGKSPLENSCGGFIYTKDYLEKKVTRISKNISRSTAISRCTVTAAVLCATLPSAGIWNGSCTRRKNVTG